MRKMSREITITWLLDLGGPLDGISVTNEHDYPLRRTNVAHTARLPSS